MKNKKEFQQEKLFTSEIEVKVEGPFWVQAKPQKHEIGNAPLPVVLNTNTATAICWYISATK